MQPFNYKKHSIYVLLFSIVLCVLFFWMVLLSELKKLDQQKQKEDELKSRVIRTSVPANIHTMRQIQHQDVIAEIMQIAGQYHIEVQSINNRINQGDITHVNVIARASFPSFLSFVESLSMLCILLNNLSLHVEKDSVMLIKTTLAVYPNEMQDKTKSFFGSKRLNNPMKQLGTHFTLDDHEGNKISINNISIKQLHFAGYLIENNHIKGILKSTTGNAWVVMPGMNIGLENARVVKVYEGGVVLAGGARKHVIVISSIM